LRAILLIPQNAILSPVAAFTPRSLPSTVRAVKEAAPAAASPDPRYETQRGRNTDGEEDLQVVIHVVFGSSIDDWRFAPKIVDVFAGGRLH
jgi:hypothetical protein